MSLAVLASQQSNSQVQAPMETSLVVTARIVEFSLEAFVVAVLAWSS